MRLSLLAPALLAAGVAGCATEGPYYGYGYDYGSGYAPGYYAPGYYAYDYGPYYYGPSYYGPSYYGPDYFAFSYRSGDGHYWDGSHNWNGTTHSWNNGTRTWQQGSVRTAPRTSGTVQTQPRASSRTYAQTHPRNSATHGTARGRANEARHDQFERQQRSRVASAPHGPDREHGGWVNVAPRAASARQAALRVDDQSAAAEPAAISR
jgi:hypothetical protein